MLTVLDERERHGIGRNMLDQIQGVSVGHILVAHALQNPSGAPRPHNASEKEMAATLANLAGAAEKP